MAGRTTTSSLADSLETIVASARIVREFGGVMVMLPSKVTLDPNTGLGWQEIDLAKLTAGNVTEQQTWDNPQQITDTSQTITPTLSVVQTFITDRAMVRVATETLGRIGVLGQNAINRKKDIDGLTQLDAATTSFPGAGSTLTNGHIESASWRITSNTTEPAPETDPLFFVGHGFQIKSLADVVLAGVGSTNIDTGLTQDIFQNRFRGRIAAVQIFEDGNIPIDSGNDAKGGVFAKSGIILVQGRSPYEKHREEPDIGGGGMSVWLYDEFAYGERSAGNWVYEIFSDAPTPSS